MPTITRTIGRFDLESIDHDSWSSRGSKAWTLNLEEIMDGSTITAAKLDINVDVSNSNSSALLWLGSAPSSGSGGKKISITNARSSSYNVLSLFSGKTTFSASDKVTFTYQVNANNPKGSGTGHFKGYTSDSTLVLTLTYVEPYTACTPPTTLAMAKATSGPSETVRLSWSGAQAGTNNPIASYTVYRSTDNSTWEVLQSGIENEYLDVTAPGTNGSTYYYSVVAVGTVAGYDSAKSSSASLQCSYTAPTVSNVQLDAGSVTIYKPAGSTAVLSWAGTAGTNNPIARYAVYRNGTLLQDVTGATSLTVDVPAAGGNYYFGVVAVGAYSNSASVTSPTVYAYSDPSAPSAVALAKAECGKGETVRLSWSGASAGAQNAITGYRVYRSTSEDGTYTQLGEDIASTDTSGFLGVVSDTRKGRSYYYKVVTIGAHSASAMSSAVSLKTVWTAPAVTSISLSADTVAPGATSELRFAVADGTNNPVTAIEVYQGETKLATLGASAASYTVTAGSNAGDQLSFTVKPIGTVEDGEASLAVMLKSYGPVAAPASVTVSNSTPDAGTNVVLSWAASVDGTFNPVQSYQVYRASASGGPFTALGSPVTGTSLSATAPSVMGNAYYYVVVAKGLYTDSGYSSTVAVTAKVYTVPTAPTAAVSPSVCGIGDTPVLSWSGAQAGTNNPITGYRVFRSTSETGTFTQLGADLAANVSSLTVDQPPTMGASYYYRVYAIGTKAGFLLSNASNTAQLTRKVYSKCGTPSVSISAELANPGSTVTISWNASADGTNNPVTGYKVFKNSGSGYALYQTVGANVLSVTDTVAASGTTQRYYVQAVSAFDGFSSDNSAVVSVVSNTAPSAVVLTVQPDRYYESGNQHFEWRDSSDPDGGTIYYDIQYRYAAAVSPTVIWLPWQDIVDSPVTDTYLDYDISLYWSLRRAIPFAFRFRSRDSLGLTSDWTESREFIRNSSPITPAIVYPTSSPTIYDVQPYIVADIVADPDGHGQYIDMSIDDGAYQQVAFPNTSVGRKAVRCYEALSYGEHTVAIRMRDALGAVSDAASVTLTVVDPAWARDIEPGVIISRSEYHSVYGEPDPGGRNGLFARISDAIAEPIEKVECHIQVKREENKTYGDRPWGPGGSKNFIITPYADGRKTINGITFIVDDSYKGIIRFTGASTGSASFTLVHQATNMRLPNGYYYLTGKSRPSSGALSDKIKFRYKVNASDNWTTVDANAETPILITSGMLAGLQLLVQSGYNTTGRYIYVYPMLRRNGDANFVPYINRWPVTGSYIVSVHRTDENFQQTAIASVSFQSVLPGGFGGYAVIENGICRLTVTHKRITSYAGEVLPGEWVSSYDYDMRNGTPTLGATVAYELAEPETYEMPLELPSFLDGTNIVTEIECDKLLVTYRRTPISHQPEVEQLYALVNASRAYYNISPVSVPASVGEDYANAGAGKIGMFAAWGSQMLALYNALKDIFSLIGVSAPTLTITAGMPPTASIINTIRTMIESA